MRGKIQSVVQHSFRPRFNVLHAAERYHCPHHIRRIQMLKDNQSKRDNPIVFMWKLFLLLSDVSYTLTLDADLQASRVTSRGLFTSNNERLLTEKAKISSSPLCQDFEVYVQVKDQKLLLLFLQSYNLIFVLAMRHFDNNLSKCGFFNRKHQTLSTP